LPGAWPECELRPQPVVCWQLTPDSNEQTRLTRNRLSACAWPFLGAPSAGPVPISVSAEGGQPCLLMLNQSDGGGLTARVVDCVSSLDGNLRRPTKPSRPRSADISRRRGWLATVAGRGPRSRPLPGSKHPQQYTALSLVLSVSAARGRVREGMTKKTTELPEIFQSPCRYHGRWAR